MLSFKEHIAEEIHAPGTQVAFPHKGKMTSGKVVRFQKGSLHQAAHYVIYHGEYQSAEVPPHKVEKYTSLGESVRKCAGCGKQFNSPGTGKFCPTCNAIDPESLKAKSTGLYKETVDPKFERATKTEYHYTGKINGKTYVVPHSYNYEQKTSDKVTPMHHHIVVSLNHVIHNNPSLKPEEHARIHQHILDIHGGQESAKILDEGLEIHGTAQSYDPVAKKWSVDHKKYRVNSDNRKLALNHIVKKLQKDFPHHKEHEAKILDEGAPKPEAQGKLLHCFTCGRPRIFKDDGKLKCPVCKTKKVIGEDLKADWNLDFSKNRRSNIRRSMKQGLRSTEGYGKGNKAWKRADKEYRSNRPFTVSAGLQEEPMIQEGRPRPNKHWLNRLFPKGATNPKGFVGKLVREAINHGDEVQISDHYGLDRRQRGIVLHPSKVRTNGRGVPTDVPGAYKPVDHKKEHVVKLHNGSHAVVPKRLLTKVLKEDTMNEGANAKSFHDVATLHQTKIAIRTLHMPDAILGVMGGGSKEDARAHLKKMGWTDKQIHQHEHGLDENTMAHLDKQQLDEVRLGLGDHRVIKSFINGETKEGKKLSTNGKTLSANWMGGSNIAHHDSGKIHLNDSPERLNNREVKYSMVVHRAIRRHAPSFRIQHESVEQLVELKFPDTGLFGAHPREIAGRVHDMGHHELKSLHKSYEKNPPKSVVQKQQHRSIKKALRKYGDTQGTHDYVDKTKFVKRDLKEAEHATLNEEGLHAYKVIHKGREIDKVFYGSHQDPEDVKRSLVHHDGYHPDIKVTKERKTMKESSSTLKTVKSVLNEAFTRRHFKQIAELIKGHTDAKTRQRLADTHAAAFEKDNPRFDHARFHAAAGTVHKKD